MAAPFTWPHEAAPLPVAPLRPTLEHLQALASRYPDVLELVDPLEIEDDVDGEDVPGDGVAREKDPAAEDTVDGEAALVQQDPRLAASDTTVVGAAVAGAAGGSRGAGTAGATPEAGDPARFLPPALAGVADEFGGIQVRGQQAGLTIVVEQRSDLGPYTLLTDPVTFTPVYEGEDVALVLSIDPAGAPGPVYGIDEDLALVLAAEDLGDYLQRYARALDEALAANDPAAQDPTAEGSPSAEDVAAHLQERFFVPLVGPTGETGPGDEQDGATAPDGEPGAAVTALVPSAPASAQDLPAGTVAVADLTGAEVGTRVDVMAADVPDLLSTGLAWGPGGRSVLLVEH